MGTYCTLKIINPTTAAEYSIDCGKWTYEMSSCPVKLDTKRFSIAKWQKYLENVLWYMLTHEREVIREEARWHDTYYNYNQWYLELLDYVEYCLEQTRTARKAARGNYKKVFFG